MTDPAPYYEVADLRALVPAISDPVRFPDALLEGLIAEYEPIAERARGVAYRVRTVTESLGVAAGTNDVVLGHLYIGTVVSATRLAVGSSSGPTVLVQDSDFTLPDAVGGTLTLSRAWCDSTLTITYTHGYDAPPPAILRGCREFVRFRALAEVNDERRNVIGEANLATGESWRYGTADWSQGRYTGITTVDDAINSVPDERSYAVA